MANTWSHISENLTSTTPGYLGEVYTGNLYEVKSGPTYGPNQGPPAEMIEKALSPAASIKAGEVRAKGCVRRCHRSGRCLKTISALVFVFFMVGIIIVGLIGFGVIHILPDDFGEIYEKEYKFPHRTSRPSVVETAVQDNVPIAMAEVQSSPSAYSITSGFETRIRPAPSEPTYLH